MKSQQNYTNTFGKYFRQRRLELEMTLRSFCQRYGYDPAYISRIERDILAPPDDKEKLKAFAKALNIKEGTEDWVTFFDLAYISKGQIPKDLASDKNSIDYLPLLFRTVRGKKVTSKNLKKLINLLNES